MYIWVQIDCDMCSKHLHINISIYICKFMIVQFTYDIDISYAYFLTTGASAAQHGHCRNGQQLLGAWGGLSAIMGRVSPWVVSGACSSATTWWMDSRFNRVEYQCFNTMGCWFNGYIYIYWLVVWLPFLFFLFSGNNHPNWRTHNFSGVKR